MAKKQYKSVVEMTRDLAKDQEFSEELEKHIAARKIVKQLVALRSVRGLSQADVAVAMKCTQSRISKLENGIDDDLRVGDLDGYLDALGLHGRLLITKKQSTIADSIRYHWSCLGQLLDRLLDLASNDAQIAVGVGKLSNEIAYNYMSRIIGFIKQLPAEARKVAPTIGIEVEEVCLDDDKLPEQSNLESNSHCGAAS